MSVHANPTSPQFKENAHAALADPQLQAAMAALRVGFQGRRRVAISHLPEFEALRDSARDIKNHTLAHLDLYLEAYEAKVIEAGGHVHYARDAAEARRIVLDIAKTRDARTVTKGKSMISEEIALNDALDAAGIVPVETDLGEYIVQLRGEIPSHIIGPAVHLTKEQVEEDFRRVHTHLPADRDLAEPVQLLTEARKILRAKFLASDIGITGANFLVAETGTSIIVTNEGNGDLTQTLPKVHVVLASLEKVRADVGGRVAIAARAGALGDRPGHERLHDAFHGAAPRKRCRRAGGIPCRADRQRSHIDDRHGVSGHAALHPLRCLHEPLPGLSCRRRTHVWMGLSRTDGRGADAIADRRRDRRQSAECFDLLRPLRGSVPCAHSIAEDDAALA